MKTLFIIRHAKSDQRFFGNDFERPLNERGKTDAPVMAERLKTRYPSIGLLVSSPAKRAKKTAELFAGVFRLDENEIHLVTALYHAPAEIFNEVIGTLPDSTETVALFSHNPGITYFVNQLIPDVRIDNMPTCGIFAIEFEGGWNSFEKKKKKFLFFDYPKNEI